jgi:hypothetical protein
MHWLEPGERCYRLLTDLRGIDLPLDPPPEPPAPRRTGMEIEP